MDQQKKWHQPPVTLPGTYPIGMPPAQDEPASLRIHLGRASEQLGKLAIGLRERLFALHNRLVGEAPAKALAKPPLGPPQESIGSELCHVQHELTVASELLASLEESVHIERAPS